MMSINQSETWRRELEMKSFLQQARDESGLSDYGNEDFFKPFSKFLECVAGNINFHAAGLKDFKDETVRILINRLRFENDLKQHREILDEDVSDPIIILGLPRSGTTKTQRMIGTDPNLLKTYLWQLRNPAPFPNAVAGQKDPRIYAASLADRLTEGDPELDTGHHFSAEQVDEDWLLFTFTLNDNIISQRAPTFAFEEWLMSRKNPSDLDNYRYVRSLFQYLQWQQGGRQNRRWLMKHCGHMVFMEELLTVFPKATLLHVHRDPVDCLPSYAKLLVVIRSLRENSLDPKSVCEHLFRWEKIAVDRYLETRDRLKLNDRIFDVQYNQIRDDPLPVIKEIYQRAGHELTAESEQAMLQLGQDNEQGKYGKHTYSLEEFGLSKQKIEGAFGEYIQRFIKR